MVWNYNTLNKNYLQVHGHYLMTAILKRKNRDEAWGLARREEGFFIEECQVINVKLMIELEKSAFSNISIIID